MKAIYKRGDQKLEKLQKAVILENGVKKLSNLILIRRLIKANSRMKNDHIEFIFLCLIHFLSLPF